MANNITNNSINKNGNIANFLAKNITNEIIHNAANILTNNIANETANNIANILTNTMIHEIANNIADLQADNRTFHFVDSGARAMKSLNRNFW